MGFGSSVIQRLVKTSIKKNLYFEIKEKVIEESFEGYRVNRNKRLVRVFGLDSTRDVRARLIEILYDRVNYHKDKFVARILHDEMESMEVKKSGKIEHSSTSHDDQVFSYLMALYVWYDGKNVMENFNIQKNTIRTDADEEIQESEITESEDIEKIDIDEVVDVDENSELRSQLEYIKEASRYKLGYMFNNEVYMNEEADLEYLLATNKQAKSAYCKKYNIDEADVNTPMMVTIPMSAFLDDDEIEEADRMIKQGNLFDQFNNL